jgi:hypothetical protein
MRATPTMPCWGQCGSSSPAIGAPCQPPTIEGCCGSIRDTGPRQTQHMCGKADSPLDVESAAGIPGRRNFAQVEALGRAIRSNRSGNPLRASVPSQGRPVGACGLRSKTWRATCLSRLICLSVRMRGLSPARRECCVQSPTAQHCGTRGNSCSVRISPTRERSDNGFPAPDPRGLSQ